jgi:hypothetical protein
MDKGGRANDKDQRKKKNLRFSNKNESPHSSPCSKALGRLLGSVNSVTTEGEITGIEQVASSP